ncbi:hypothetical protein ARSEF4850_002919 [Beauveria asiatica]
MATVKSLVALHHVPRRDAFELTHRRTGTSLLHSAPRPTRCRVSKGHDGLLALLPASYRTESGDLAAACQHATAYVEEKELDLQRLTSIRGWLWVAGLPLPPRALHHQLLLGREIFVTERMDMNLVWTAGRMFLKPIPRFLLDPAFWN